MLTMGDPEMKTVPTLQELCVHRDRECVFYAIILQVCVIQTFYILPCNSIHVCTHTTEVKVPQSKVSQDCVG